MDVSLVTSMTAEEYLARLIASLGPQEREAVKLVSEKYDTATTINVAGRIKMGQDHYGRLDLANDPRDWLAEAAEEDWDGIAYRAFHELKQSILGEK